MLFYLISTMIKQHNDQGDSTGDRFYYVQSYENIVERDMVDSGFDVNQFDDEN